MNWRLTCCKVMNATAKVLGGVLTVVGGVVYTVGGAVGGASEYIKETKSENRDIKPLTVE